MKLRVHSIFESFDGEVNGFHQGRRATFVRLAGCNLTCSYCDTKQALDPMSGVEMGIGEVAEIITNKTPSKITITGGEPLLQAEGVQSLLNWAWRMRPGLDFSIETNGSLPIPPGILDRNLSLVVDYKLPGTGIPSHLVNHKDTYPNLDKNDVIKFVIGDEKDYTEAVMVAQMLFNNGCKALMAFSPMHGGVEPDQLADWLLLSPLRNVVLSIQLHKYFFNDGEKKLQE